ISLLLLPFPIAVQRKFDVRIKDVDEVNFLDLVDEMIDEAMKQDDEVKVFIEEAASVGVSFRLAVEKREARLRAEALKQKELQKAMEEERKRVEEERKRIEEEEKIEREIEEAKKYTVAIEVPVVNVDDMNVEFQRVFSSPAADEVFPGFSQPPVTQESELSDSEPHHAQAKTTPDQQKTTASQQKTSPTQQKTTASQQKTTPAQQKKTAAQHKNTAASEQNRTPTQHQHTPSHQNTQRKSTPSTHNNTTPTQETAPVSSNTRSNKSVGSSSKPFRPAKTSSKRKGTYVPKTKGGTRVTTRGRKSIQPQEDPSEDDESPWGSDTSEDDDYVQSDVSDEEDLEDLDLVNEFGDEDDVDAPITSKSFEDCLDGSSYFDQLYKNGTVVGEMEFGEVKLEQWMIFSNKEHFLGTFRDFCIQEGFAVRVEKADNVRFTATCIVQDCDWRIHASRLMDGISWAIKSIIGEHKLCGRLEENPMVSSAWLIRHLREDITATPDKPVESLQTLCMNRFRVKGVEAALHEVFPQATRRICSQHLYMNCKTAGYSGGAFQKLFWTVDDAYNTYVFKKAMTKIGELDKSAVHYLENVDEQWSRHAFDPLVCYDHNTTNFVESFNACTKPYRDLPVMTLFDKAIDMEPNALTDFAMKVLEERGQESRLCSVVSAGGGEFEGTGIPCRHGLRVIYDQRLEPTDFVSPYFKGTSYKLTYSDHIHPMPDSSYWPDFALPIIQPPSIKRSAGRPTKQRRRGRFEKKKGKRNSTVKCTKCKQVGHNTRTCKGGATAKQRYSAASTPSQASQPSQASSSKGGKRKDAAKTSTSKAAQKKTKYTQ
ncbi:Reticulocyte binding protein 2-like protein b, partial [Bienertia sinuspersici]